MIRDQGRPGGATIGCTGGDQLQATGVGPWSPRLTGRESSVWIIKVKKVQFREIMLFNPSEGVILL